MPLLVEEQDNRRRGGGRGGGEGYPGRKIKLKAMCCGSGWSVDW